MKNIDDLIKTLTKEREDLKSGKITPVVMAELNNNAGKIINASKLSFEYQRATRAKNKVSVGFLNTDD